jgi:hypothetical protein
LDPWVIIVSEEQLVLREHQLQEASAPPTEAQLCLRHHLLAAAMGVWSMGVLLVHIDGGLVDQTGEVHVGLLEVNLRDLHGH